MKIHPITDKFAAGLSIACALHCLLVPSFLIVTSGALALSIDNELIHWAILFLAIPISVYALISGVSNHDDYGLFLVGLAGLGVLTASALSSFFNRNSCNYFHINRICSCSLCAHKKLSAM